MGISQSRDAQIIKQATVFGNALMAEALAKSMAQVESENQRYAWSSQPRGYTARQMHDREKLAEEQRLGQAAKALIAKKAVLSKAMAEIGGIQWEMRAVPESDMAMLEHLAARSARSNR